jgi:putative tricarboxylic transport membrane protein
MLEHIALGFAQACAPPNLVALAAGVAVGVIFGVLPGLDATSGVTLVLPFTYGMSPLTSLILLTGIYTGAEYGGSVSAICIGLPGTPAAASSVLDGYALRKKGFPGKALGAAITGSFCGGVMGSIALVLLAFPLTALAVIMGPVEYTALGVFALSIVSSLAGRSMVKGFIACGLGLLVATVGIDPFTTWPRFTFGTVDLLAGVDLIAFLLGLFALSEAFMQIESIDRVREVVQSMSTRLPSRREVRGLMPTIFRSGIIGIIIGVMPAVGAATANWIAYNEARRWSRRPEEFGHGSLEGIAAPEAANNASVGGALVPLLTLGIPGSATTAVMLGAFTLHGLIPGTQLFTGNADIVYGLFVSVFLMDGALLILGLVGTRLWVKALNIPHGVLITLIFALSFVGAYSVRNSLFDVGTCLAFGVGGYILRKFDFSVIPMVIAMVLSFLIETNLRRALVLSDGSFLIFVTRPLSVIFLLLGVLTFLYPLFVRWRERERTEAPRRPA